MILFNHLPSFGTIRNNTALKQIKGLKSRLYSFGTIRNNTALKQIKGESDNGKGFGTIRNNTALKQVIDYDKLDTCFGTIRNNTALKQGIAGIIGNFCFGTIRNNTALKPRRKIFSRNFVIAPFVPARLQLVRSQFLLLLYHIFGVQEIVLIQYILRKIIDFPRLNKQDGQLIELDILYQIY